MSETDRNGARPEGPERVALSVENGLARLRLTRPPGNGIDLAMVDALAAAVTTCATRPDVRALLLSAEGRHLSVGGDLPSLREAGVDMPELLDTMIASYHQTLARLADLPIPVVCAAQGAVAGGGLGLLWVSDIIIAAEDLRLTPAFAAIGLTGDGGSSWYLPRLIGLHRALDLVMHNRTLDATEARDLGLVSSVVPLERLDAEAGAVANALAAGPTKALGGIRQMYRRGLADDLVGQLAREQATIVAAARTADGQEGMDAFTRKQPPRYRGS